MNQNTGWWEPIYHKWMAEHDNTKVEWEEAKTFLNSLLNEAARREREAVLDEMLIAVNIRVNDDVEALEKKRRSLYQPKPRIDSSSDVKE